MRIGCGRWSPADVVDCAVGRELWRAILDCGDAAAVAQMALALGWRNLVLRGKASVREKITQIAESYGAEVLSRPPKAFDPGAQATDITVQLRTVF